MIEKRRFGRTGHMSTVALFGAAALKNVSQGDANRALELLLRYGVNHIDTAPRYGDAELRIGPWMRSHRRDFFLATKIGQRTRAAARDEIRRSLRGQDSPLPGGIAPRTVEHGPAGSPDGDVASGNHLRQGRRWGAKGSAKPRSAP